MADKLLYSKYPFVHSPNCSRNELVVSLPDLVHLSPWSCAAHPSIQVAFSFPFRLCSRVHSACTSFPQFSSVAQSCPTLCDPMDCSTPGLPVHHHLLEITQTHVHPVSDAIQPSHSLSSPSLPAFNLSQHQGLFKWVSSSYQVANVLEFKH